MIPVFKPSYGNEEVLALKKVLLSGWVGLGPKTEEFEKKFADYIGVKYAIALNSATAALHLGLMVLDVKGKEIITTPMTFVSTNHAILYNNAIPVFTDIQPDTLNIDPLSIKKNITKKTKGIIAVHFGGHPCDMNEILKIAHENKLFVLEDAAHACGASYGNKKIGAIGELGSFSFHAVKNLATGDGGMLTTNNKKIYERLLKLRWCGINKSTWNRDKSLKYSWFYNVDELGYKCHMNDINAVIGIVQLKKIDDLNKKRNFLASIYDKAFKKISWITIPTVKDGIYSARHNYVIKTPFRDHLNIYLGKRKISTGVHYYPNNLYPMYKKYGKSTPIAHQIWKKLLTLPLYPDLKVKEIENIISSILDFGKKYVKE